MKVYPADRVIVIGFIGVLEAYLYALFIFFKYALHGDGFLIVIALQLGAARFLQELHLFGCLNALAYRVYAQSCSHLEQLREYYPAALVELLHEAHIELYQIELYALQYIK